MLKIPPLWSLLLFTHSIVYAQTIFVGDNHKYGLISQEDTLFRPSFDDLRWGGDLQGGRVLIYSSNGFYGLLSPKGKKITQPTYRSLHHLTDKFFVASVLGKVSKVALRGVLDQKGRVVFSFKYDEFRIGLEDHIVASEWKGDQRKWCVYDKKGVRLMKAYFTDITTLDDTLYVMRDQAGDKWVYDQTLTKISTDAFDDFIVKRSDSIIGQRNGNYGVINQFGKTLLNPRYKSYSINKGGFHFTKNHHWVLLDSLGEEKNSFYHDTVAFAGWGALYFRSNGVSGILDAAGNAYAKGKGWKLNGTNNEFLFVNHEGKQGVLTYKGQQVVPIVYDSIYFDSTYFYALEHHRKGNRWSIYNKFGREISAYHYQDFKPLQEGFIAVRRNRYWGFINFDGVEEISCKFEYVEPFQNHRAVVTYLEQQGVIDQFGEWVVLPYKDHLEVAYKDVFCSFEAGRTDLINDGGNTIFQTYNTLIKHDFGFIEVLENGAKGLLNRYGRLGLSPMYDSISPLINNQVYVIAKDQKYGVIHRHGYDIMGISHCCDQITGVSDGLIGFKMDGKYGFADMNGVLRIANRYDSVFFPSEGLIPVKLLHKWGVVDLQENIVLQPRYDSISKFEDGLAVACIGDQCGIITAQGDESLPIQYDHIHRLNNGMFVIKHKGKFGVVSRLGEELIYPRYDFVEEIEGNRFIVQQRGKFGVLNISARFEIPLIYDHLTYSSRAKSFLGVLKNY